MANRVISRNITKQSTTSDRIVFFIDSVGSIGDSDALWYTYQDNMGNDNIRVANINKIEKVIVSSGELNVSQTGGTPYYFGTGTWDFSETGGLPILGLIPKDRELLITGVGTNPSIVIVLRA